MERNVASGPDSDDASTRDLLADGVSPVHARVQAFWDGGRASSWLPPRGEIVIGRSSQCGLRIDHPSVSREHARLRGGSPASIEDLESANGVFVRGLRIAPRTPVAVFPGDVVALASVLLVVQAPAMTVPDLAREGPPPPPLAPPDVAGAAASPMQAVHRLIELVADSELSVLVLGETGVGKTTCAEALHAKSRRAKQPFIRVHCPSFPETLLESELFGHERGAFTGAATSKPGLLESADGGTVFLDEIGELPLTTQAKLLSVVENREVLRLGSLKPRRVDVRFITATNRDLEAYVPAGGFREDLYHRLNGLSIVIPPLRARTPEIASLARDFLATAATRAGRPPPLLADATVRMLAEHAWPGNVRELKNVMERLVVLCREPVLRPEHVRALGALRPGPSGHPGPSEVASEARDAAASLRDELNTVERERIERALESCNGNQSQVAKLLGISRRSLIRRLEAYGIKRPLKDA